jgi:hypothetical protein
MPYLRDVLVRLGVFTDTLESAVTWERFPAFHAAVTGSVAAALGEPCRVTCRLTHVYPDGPAPYFTVLAPARRGDEVAQWHEMKQAAGRAILDAGGTITHHHGVGRDHRPWYDAQRPDAFAAALARAADLVLASGYNEHSATTAPGPVTTQAGFAALAAYAAATSEAKVAPTMGAFGYRWTGGSARMISSADAERRWPAAAEVGSADDRSVPGATPTWYESAEDLWAREQAARRAGTRWIGLFSLGREPERFWERSSVR